MEYGDDFVGRVERVGEKFVWSRFEVVLVVNKGVDVGVIVEMVELVIGEME